MYGYVYLTKNLETGRLYVGQHKGKFNHYYLGSGVALANSIKKYGRKRFTVEPITFCNTYEELNAEEIRLIARYRQTSVLTTYNRADGGDVSKFNPMLGKKHSEATKAKMSIDRKGKSHRGTPHSEESKAKLSIAAKNRKVHPRLGAKLSEESKRKIGLANSGINSHKFGKPITEAHRLAIVEANKRRKGIKKQTGV